MRWDNNIVTWGQLNQVWNLIVDIGGPHPDPIKIEKLDNSKKKKLVRLIMHMKGVKVYDEQKEIKKVHHQLDDIKLIAEEIKKHVQIIHG